MGLASAIESLLKTIVPPSDRQGGGTFITYAPNAAKPQKFTAAATFGKAWPNVVQLLAAGGNLTDAWIEAVEFSDPSAVGTFLLALGYCPVATGAPGVPTVANHGLEGIVASYVEGAAVNAGPFAQVVPCNPPIHIPGGNLIEGSVLSSVANGDVLVRLILSRNKTHKP